MSVGIAYAVEVVVLSLKRCREILGTNCDLSDEELETLRKHLHAAAEIALDGFVAANDSTGDGSALEIERKTH